MPKAYDEGVQETMVSMMAAPKLVFSTSAEIRAFRQKHGMNQSQFWGRVGVTQSGGSRYESERNIPRPVQLLLHIVYAPDDRAHRLVDHLRKWKSEPTPGA